MSPVVMSLLTFRWWAASPRRRRSCEGLSGVSGIVSNSGFTLLKTSEGTTHPTSDRGCPLYSSMDELNMKTWSEFYFIALNVYLQLLTLFKYLYFSYIWSNELEKMRNIFITFFVYIEIMMNTFPTISHILWLSELPPLVNL